VCASIVSPRSQIPPPDHRTSSKQNFFSSHIIAILAAILFPVFARAREKARQTSCLSNVKQIALACMMYAQDYDERLPHRYLNSGVAGAIQYPGGGSSRGMIWPNPVYPYVNNIQVFNCPSWGYRWTGRYTGRQAYGISNHIDGMLLAHIEAPAETILLADAYDASGSAQSYYIQRSISLLDGEPRTIIPDRHNDGANFGLADGHAKWHKVDMEGNIARRAQEFQGFQWDP
jgi:prepilin-type processing-associated H-X9-DG protein